MTGHADTIRLHDQLRAVEAERDALLTDNQRVRDALREIKEHDYLDGDECRRIAREALAGDAE